VPSTRLRGCLLHLGQRASSFRNRYPAACLSLLACRSSRGNPDQLPSDPGSVSDGDDSSKNDGEDDQGGSSNGVLEGQSASRSQGQELIVLDGVCETLSSVLSTILSEVQQRRNELSTFNMLITDDILMRIIRALLDDFSHDVRTRFTLSHVSRRWRTLFLQNASLWTRCANKIFICT